MLAFCLCAQIFGFENFALNSFEQLCINYCNEKLHQFFLACVFKSEQEVHEQEGVPWADVPFADNQPTIDVLEGAPSGVLRLLDSTCRTPNGTERAFLETLNKEHAKSGVLKPPRSQRLRDDEGFVVRHFAGEVVYHAGAVVARACGVAEVSWLDKNNDTLDGAWLQCLAGASQPMLKQMFAAEASAALEASSRTDSIKKGAGAFNSICKKFGADLAALLSELQARAPVSASAGAFRDCPRALHPTAPPHPPSAAAAGGARLLHPVHQAECGAGAAAARAALGARPAALLGRRRGGARHAGGLPHAPRLRGAARPVRGRHRAGGGRRDTRRAARLLRGDRARVRRQPG